MKGNAIVAQSGGPTAVINASAAGVIHAALEAQQINRIYAAHNGILGVLNNEIYDLGLETPETLEELRWSPSSALGSCRHKVKSDEDRQKIIDIFKKHDIRYFFYIGGNDSMDTADKVSKLAQKTGYEMRAVGVPKTIDNDLAETDHCPGYGSVIKYLATITMEAGRDTEAMYTADTVNIIEAMGRNAGWIAAGTALARRNNEDAPHIILLPEVPFNRAAFSAKVQHYLDTIHRCVIVVSEGTKYPNGSFLNETKGDFAKDAFGHVQLGGAAQALQSIVQEDCRVKARIAMPSTIQRAGAHFASLTDNEEAYGAGRQAVKAALEGVTDKMVTLVRESDAPYKCHYGLTDLSKVANGEKFFPKDWITDDGFFVTEDFTRYALPLIQGETKPPMQDGLPRYIRTSKHFI
ncbi:MAG: 6-phosphofructokinase [Spirochaetes bacterium]|nr:MAG: 6-phosphofructokinase [Spirochaetota bacterium]RKX97925.1 MAG: 6-phosphofructokinase [Spirochaetota bacterium]